MTKSTTGFVLALIGGILQVLVGLLLTMVFNLASNANLITGGPSYFYSLFGVWILVFGALSIVGGVKMNSEDSATVKKWGIATIIFSVASMLNLLTFIGGILGVVQSSKK